MCGRFANAADWDQYVHLLAAHLPDPSSIRIDPAAPSAYHARHNVGPATEQPIVSLVRTSPPANSDTKTDTTSAPEVVVQPRHWGVTPAATKGRMLINARAETVLEGRMWGPMVQAGGRGVLFVQGFFERSDRTRAPYYFRPPASGERSTTRRHGLLALGVVYDAGGFVIVTVPAAEWMRPIHDRQPLILDDAGVRDWLGLASLSTDISAGGDKATTGTGDGAWQRRLVTRHEPLELYPVPPEVNNVRNDNPSFVLPLHQRKGGIESFLGKAKARAPAVAPPPPKSAHADRRMRNNSAAVKSEETGEPGATLEPARPHGKLEDSACDSQLAKGTQGDKLKSEPKAEGTYSRLRSRSPAAAVSNAPQHSPTEAREKSRSEPAARDAARKKRPGPSASASTSRRAPPKRAKGLDRFFALKSKPK